MHAPHAERLVYTHAADDLELCGAVFGDPDAAAIVAVSHGSGARFCDRAYVELGRELAANGHALLTGDTRGHDIAGVQQVGDDIVALGAAFERFDRSIADVATWLAFARTLRPASLVAAGHSMGAAKTVRALQLEPADGLILLSPAVSWPANTQRVELADRMVADGRGAELMPARTDSPSWNLVSARTLHERAQSIEGVFATTDSPWSVVDMPTLVVFGGAEDGAEDAVAKLRAGWSSRRPLTCHLIDGADHDYRGCIKALADITASWLNDHFA